MAVYCAGNDLEGRLSQAGVELRGDDDPATLSEVLDEASSTVDFYLSRLYDPAGYPGNRWVKHATANIGALLLCERRGNPVPASITDKHDRTMAELKLVLAGTVPVPGLTPRRSPVPQLSNHRPKLGPVPHTVVERETSPKRDRPTDYRQNVDPISRPEEYDR